MDAEVTEGAGPKGKHDPARTAYRHGTDDGVVTSTTVWLGDWGIGGP
ncbi:MAG: hypothetical protein ACRDWX_03060 [Acidimicrobiia bacterium]